MQQQSLRFLTTVPTDVEETELARIREGVVTAWAIWNARNKFYF